MTVLHGTCLLNGRHPPGSALGDECPALRRQRRQELRKAGAVIRIAAPPEIVERTGAESGISNTIIRDGRANRPGRPRVSAEQKREGARERARAFRRRRRGGTGP